MNSGRPMVGSMEEGSASSSGDVTNAVFSLAVLVVGIHTTEGKVLTRGSNGVTEELSVKQFIVGMVVLDRDRMGVIHLFRSGSGSNSGLSIHASHEMDVGKV